MQDAAKDGYINRQENAGAKAGGAAGTQVNSNRSGAPQAASKVSPNN